MSILSAALILLLVMDPLGNSAMFLSILKDVDKKRQKRIILREVLFALVVLIFFLFCGRLLLSALHIEQSSLSISGGIILFLIAITMIFKGSQDTFKSEGDDEPFFVPLAVPLLAGPSAMATVMLFMAQDPQNWPKWLIAVVSAWGVSAIILYWSSSLGNLIGRRGLRALDRLMGMILTIVAVQMFTNGMTELVVEICSKTT